MVSKNNTKIVTADGVTVITLHQTDVVKFNSNTVTLNSGGWRTVTTKARMNQAAIEFSLDYSVFARNGKWFVCLDSETQPFYDGIRFNRTQT